MVADCPEARRLRGILESWNPAPGYSVRRVSVKACRLPILHVEVWIDTPIDGTQVVMRHDVSLELLQERQEVGPILHAVIQDEFDRFISIESLIVW